MKSTEIAERREYENQAGARRLVLGFTNNRATKGAEDRVRYRVTRGHALGGEYECKRTTFAKWAAADVTPAPAAADGTAAGSGGTP